MKRFSEQLHKKSQTVKLKKSEQADLRDRIVSYMEYHPLPAAMKAQEISPTKKAAQPILTDAFAHFAIPYQMLFKLGGVAAVFVLVIIPFMAERTVPGDTLYAVKVQFNEEVRSTLTWGSYEKVEWETTRLNRRIAEARLLADEGLLTPEAEASVAAAVKEHSDNAKREIEVLRASDADEAAIATIAFDSSLQVQSQALQDDTNARTATSTSRTGMMISDVIDESRAGIPASASTSVPAYNKLMARVELNTTRVRDLRDALTGVVLEKDLDDVTRRIEDVDRAILEAIDMATVSETELDARMALADVLARTQKLIIFMTELEVRQEVTIEEVVPVVPTQAEVASDRSTRLVNLDETIAQVRLALDQVEDELLAEKLVDSLQKLEQSRASLSVTDSYSAFVLESDRAQAIADDMLLLATQQAGSLPELVQPELDTGTSTNQSATTSEEIAIDTATSSDVITDNLPPVDQSDETELATTTSSTEVEETTID